MSSPTEADCAAMLKYLIWDDIKMLRRLAVVGETSMGLGYDAAPFTANLPKAANEAWERLKALDPKTSTEVKSDR